MNNKLATSIRENGMNVIFNNIVNVEELTKIDSGKFVFPVYMENGDKYFCEIDFIAKKEDYTTDYDVKKYKEKLEKANIREKEKEEKKKKNIKKKNNDVE